MNSKCKACASTSSMDIQLFIPQADRGHVKWLFCEDCHSYFSTIDYDKESEINHTENFTSWGNEEGGKHLNIFKARMYNSIAKKIFQLKPPPSRLMDIGCSYGGFLFIMKDLGYDVEGIDIVDNALRFVQQHNIPTYKCFSIKEANIDNGTLDIVSVLDINCYWEDQKQELIEIYSKLKTGGIISLRVADKSLYLRLGINLKHLNKSIGEKLIRYSVNDHYFSMPVKSLVKELKEIGFKILVASPEGAIHSYKSNCIVKFLFKSGVILHKMFGIFIAPGAIIIGQKL